MFGVPKPGGRVQIADIANGKPVAEAALANVDLWTACIADGLPREAWRSMPEEVDFVDVRVSDPYGTLGGRAARPRRASSRSTATRCWRASRGERAAALSEARAMPALPRSRARVQTGAATKRTDRVPDRSR